MPLFTRHLDRSSMKVDAYYRATVVTVDDRIATRLSSVVPAALQSAMVQAASGGKRSRPLLAMISCAAVGGREIDALDPAVAVELLHASSLVHDDIMDGSSLRRGKPAVHVAFDVPTAILAGDALIALAFRIIHRYRSPQSERIAGLFTSAFLDVCEGQGFDLSLARQERVEVSNHRAMVEKKTARLIEAAAGIGAMCGTTDEAQIDALKEFGLNIGMAYQAQDDLLDVVGVEEAIGKPVGVDARNGKQTFLTTADSKGSSTRGVLSEVSSIVEDYTDAACRALNLLPHSEPREHLRMLAGAIVERKLS